MAAKQEINKNTANNMNCSLCTKFIKILKHKPEGEAELKCDDCGKDDPVVALCVDCELYMCQYCNKYHSRKNTEHDIVPLDATSQAIERVLYCPEHRNNELDYYCEACDKLLCIDCATKKEHNEHTHELVEKMASKHRGVLVKIIAPVEEMSENLSKAEADIVRTQEKIKEQATEIDQEIDKCYVEQLQKLNEHHKQLKEQLHNAASRKEDALTKQLTEIKLVQDELMSMKELNEHLRKVSDRKVLSKRSQDVEIQMKKVNDKYNNLTTLPVESYTMAFNPSSESLVQLGHLCTGLTLEILYMPTYLVANERVMFHIQSKDEKGQNYTEGGNRVVVKLNSSAGEITVGKITDNNDGSYVASIVAKQVGEAKLSVAINGEQIKGSPYSIVVRNYQAIDKPSKIVNNNGSMGKPWGVAFGRNGLWAVADWTNHCVYIFDDKDQLVRKFGSYGSNNGQFYYPHGITFDDQNHLYVADCYNHRVQKFDPNHEWSLTFGKYGSRDGQLYYPSGIAVYEDKAYIADYNNKRVSVFHTDGQFYNTFGSGMIGHPSNVALCVSCELYKDKYLVIAGCSPDCICIFTLDGHYIGKFGTKGSGRYEFSDPCGLTTNLDGFIIVANTGNHCASIFHNNGFSIHSFGSKGSANGQFSYPRGIALSPNGSIYVSDYDNKRIQIFSNY